VVITVPYIETGYDRDHFQAVFIGLMCLVAPWN